MSLPTKLLFLKTGYVSMSRQLPRELRLKLPGSEERLSLFMISRFLYSPLKI